MNGLVVMLTGLSGAGKSTIAGRLAEHLTERRGRAVTMLDGDVVRTMLSSELGFSREHRTLNVTRVGFVAAEVGRHGGIAICALIAPYEQSRRAARALVEGVGARFVLVHVATPLAVCERRDPKGLYARARAGEIPAFTGLDDPYETPTSADLVVDTSTTGSDEAVDLVLVTIDDREVSTTVLRDQDSCPTLSETGAIILG